MEKITKKNFPHTHKLLQWYPGLPADMKDGALYDDSTHTYLNSMSEVKYSHLPSLHLQNTVYWKQTSKENYSENLKAEIFLDSFNNSFRSIRFNCGKYLAVGQRVKFTNPIYPDVYGKYGIVSGIQKSETGEDMLKFDLEGTKGLVTYQPTPEIIYENASIITHLVDGTIIDELSENKAYYVVEPHNHKVTGPFNKRGYLTPEFKCFASESEAIEHICKIGMFLSIEDALEVIKSNSLMIISKHEEIYIKKVLLKRSKINYLTKYKTRTP